MRFSSIAILSLASVAVADLKTWNDVVGDMPQCIKTCLSNFYNTAGLKDKCGSADKATVDCLCGVKGSFADLQDDASELSTCIQDGCDTNEIADAATKLGDFQDRFESLQDQCSAKGSSNGASSVVPGFNAMLASGALLLVGVAL
ncbi:hypothetical protein PEX1_105850 [Penicillium expansum]|uniref:Extracellular membrane protein CFEM domain-containing protein n=1 Tax=Penicillium expansum TaxID=27334 RepID=A0A0A2IWB4_PENEN|nr:hypothetical protein PEX2_018630 [Penicillium expansum]KGO46776.1 hypothetical protein PEXP_064660 [Penicillium expansum]KGO62456.1 hypothetical protein PEX2_018630 [Penicillium expansum]KGO73312.1 hypothetical protein PEX1_105850 [Penicillium expansum]